MFMGTTAASAGDTVGGQRDTEGRAMWVRRVESAVPYVHSEVV